MNATLQLSNTINDKIHKPHYQFNPTTAAIYAITQLTDPIAKQIHRNTTTITITPRNQQTPELLHKLQQALTPLTTEHTNWLLRRSTPTTGAHSIDLTKLTTQEQADLHIITHTHPEPVQGPTYCDYRNGQLAGICIRNTTTNPTALKTTKYTFSNYGWFLHGYDDYTENDQITITEGIFDAIALRTTGHKAIPLGTAYPTPFQLATLTHKYKHITTCFDNDFWGWYGAYITHKCINSTTIHTNHKDPAEAILEHKDHTIHTTTKEELLHKITEELPRYNQAAQNGQLKRPLPYNQT